MKIQDIAFLLILVGLLVLRKPKLFAFVGIVFLVISIPLFYFHVFFTAERLTWYAAAFFLINIIYYFINGLKS